MSRVDNRKTKEYLVRMGKNKTSPETIEKIVKLRLDGLPYKEISVQTGVTERTIESILLKKRIKLTKEQKALLIKKSWENDEERRAQLANSNKEMWQNPDFREQPKKETKMKGNNYERLEDGNWRIQLTQGKTTAIDAEDVELSQKHTWYYHKGYACTRVKCSDGKKRTLCLNRYLLGGFAGEGQDWVADHINGNKLDNRRSNLQRITPRQNIVKGRISTLKATKTSQHTGVHWNKSSQKWQVQIRVQGKLVHLGYFADEIEASDAYSHALTIVNFGFHPKTGAAL